MKFSKRNLCLVLSLSASLSTITLLINILCVHDVQISMGTSKSLDITKDSVNHQSPPKETEDDDINFGLVRLKSIQTDGDRKAVQKEDNISDQRGEKSEDNIVQNEETKPLQNEKIKSNQYGKTKTVRTKQRYLIYLCDNNIPCFGLGDRQRAIGSLYLLAVATNRTFGVNMTRPSPFTEFYQPNEVNWVITEEEIQGKSIGEFNYLAKHQFPKDPLTTDFNEMFPQDVVYVRSNKNFMNVVTKNELYKSFVPKLPFWKLYPYAWTKTMRPTDVLRRPLNEILANISKALTSEYDFYKNFNFSKCDKTCLQTQVLPQCSEIDPVIKDNTPNYCVVTPPRIVPAMKPPKVMTLKGHDIADLDLVCVHIRMGWSTTFHWEHARNKKENLHVVWDFIKGYIDTGHHVYIATDSQEIREMALKKFGYRVHVNSEPIVHIDRVQKGQDERQGFRLTLLEQLLLSTSCKVLVVSYSNLSMKAAAVRGYIHTDKDLYRFKGGQIEMISPKKFT